MSTNNLAKVGIAAMVVGFVSIVAGVLCFGSSPFGSGLTLLKRLRPSVTPTKIQDKDIRVPAYEYWENRGAGEATIHVDNVDVTIKTKGCNKYPIEDNLYVSVDAYGVYFWEYPSEPAK